MASERWANWAPVIVGFPTRSGAGDETEQTKEWLVGEAYRHANQAVIRALSALIDHESQESSHVFILRRMEHCWDEQLCEALLEKAKTTTLSPACVGDLLTELMKRGCSGARSYAESLVKSEADLSERAAAIRREAATALWLCASDCGWQSVWPVFERDGGFFRDVMAKVAHDSRHLGLSVVRLDDEQLGELYILLSKRFPHAEDPKEEGAHCVGPRESVGRYRDNVLQILENRGTRGACRAIETILRELPHLEYLKRVLRAAQRVALRETWVPPDPQHFLQLTRRRAMRFVRSGQELVKVVVESLGRLQQKLHGETPSVRDVWDRQAQTRRWRPVDENALCDYVVRHVRDDLEHCGIVALREVEIRRGSGERSGQRTDIYVAALMGEAARGELETIRVILEAKGSWHEELKTAMRSQLRDRYLRENACQHGLYLVGWFNCEKWDADDERRGRAPTWTVEEARQFFNHQAEECSDEDTSLHAIVLDVALR